jgi:S-methylmethionine-dependent homocysteine/selenocysteine methylase
METLAETLTSAREGIPKMDGDEDAADAVIGILEDAGSQLGYLQVNCCAPGRMKFYVTTLENLNRAQAAINKSVARGH